MKHLIASAALAATMLAAPVLAAPQTYALDASHSQIVFSYNHLGFSTTYGMFSGFDGTIEFDAENPAASSVMVSFPVKMMNTGWDARDAHIMADDFFGASEEDMVTFKSTGIEVTGDNTALITGDLTMNDHTVSVVLDTTMTQAAQHPMKGKDWIGFNATTTLKRSDFGVGGFAPAVSDAINVMISIEAAAE